MAPLFEHYGIQLWMPEVGGRVDWHAEDHEQTMLALGLSSKREITRTRIRVRSAADPGRNPHRTGAAWTLRTVAAILANPAIQGGMASFVGSGIQIPLLTITTSVWPPGGSARSAAHARPASR
jgi:hypothetical protein